jgi:hypothetical protein
MNNNSVVEGNKLIAEFDGKSKVHPNDLKYHSSFDWLLLVVKKIRDYLNNMPNRPSKNHCCKGDLIEVDIQCSLWEIDIEKTWQHTVEFIKWYNNNQTPQP